MCTNPFRESTSLLIRIATCFILLLGPGCSNQLEDEENQDADTSGRQDNDSNGRGDDESGKTNNDGKQTQNDNQGSDKAKLFQYKAGDRLSPYFLNAADGASQFYGWYDNELKTPCSFQMLSPSTLPHAEGAKLRCMPPMVRRPMGNYYSDENCKNFVDVAIVDKCSDPQNIKYAQLEARSCGEGQLEVKEVTKIKVLTGEDKLWYRPNIYTPCKAQDTKSVKYVIMELGDDVELSSFVSAEASK